MNSSKPKREHFPDEVIVQILARSSLKSVYRAKSVCKLWYKLISDKYFTRLYNEVSGRHFTVLVQFIVPTSKSRSKLLLVDNSHRISKFSLDFMNSRVRVRASSNGLLCCSSVIDRGIYYVCNPLTKEYKPLPREEGVIISNADETIGVSLAFNSSKKDYIVVLTACNQNVPQLGLRARMCLICSVFDSVTNKWRFFCTLRDGTYTGTNTNSAVFVNGSLHWLTASLTRVLVLDLGSGSWRKMALPGRIISGSGNNGIYLLELDAKLSVIEISILWMNIWVVKDYAREEWEMVDRVSLGCIRGMGSGIFPISQSGEYVLVASKTHVFVYHRKSRVWMEMYTVKNRSGPPVSISAYVFEWKTSPCC